LSKIEVNTVEPQCGTTLTLGGSGDTVTLGSGASQTGFGRTGTVDWQTGSIKTTNFSAANGEGYFVDTSGGAVTMTLPAGVAGAIVSVADYGDNFSTFALTIQANGSDKISGETLPALLETMGESATLVFVDSTEGWVTVNASSENVKGSPFIQATGGTITNTPTCRIHTFTGPGSFSVTRAACSAANNVVSYIVVAGGGAGGTGNPSSSTNLGGGGGAGGFREDKSPVTPYTASPLDGAGAITVSVQTYPIVVGGGGTGQAPTGSNGPSGANSTFSTITAHGGGGGGGTQNGIAGGSGGGGGAAPSTSRSGGAGNTPPVSPAQGFAGGSGQHSPGSAKAGGGGGASAVGSNGVGGPTPPGTGSYGLGGAGVTSCITGSPVAYAGGGGGSTNNGPFPASPNEQYVAGGTGGGGCGAYEPGQNATNGTDNTGGGGGGGGASGTGPNQVGGNGGSGIVIIRYKNNN
jgi:hypothetical protein